MLQSIFFHVAFLWVLCYTCVARLGWSARYRARLSRLRRSDHTRGFPFAVDVTPGGWTVYIQQDIALFTVQQIQVEHEARFALALYFIGGAPYGWHKFHIHQGWRCSPA